MVGCRRSALSRRGLLAGGGALLLAACSSGRGAPTVRTGLGTVRGVRRDSGCAFLGIPYAQPPVGELRFAAPVPARAWTGTLDCARYGPTAQGPRPEGTIPEPTIPGDGILNLNVFTPDPSPGANRPVLVWIHGGGFTAGCSASPWYDGSAFNRDGVVLVSVGYRLGAQGFLHLDGAPDNRGVLDWIAALTWVRDNINAFGGDPAQVTVAGQSAGGGAVWALLATPSARPLFRAGICASGVLTQPNDRAAALATTARFTERTGVPATVAALRDISRDRLRQLQGALAGPELAAPLAPFADGTLIPSATTELLAGGRTPDLPLLIGCTRDEFNTGPADPQLTDADAQNKLAAFGLAPAAVDAYRAAYPGRTPTQLVGQIVSDEVIRGPSYRVAEDHARRGHPTWLYEFTWPSTAPDYRGLAAHCLDLPFAFDLLHTRGVAAAEGSAPPQPLADAMHAAWVSFVRTGHPHPNWPRYTVDTRPTMIWTADPHVESDPFAAQRAVWTA